MTPTIYTLTLRERRQEHDDIYTFLFDAPERIPYLAGQYAHLRLRSPEGNQTHEFSFSSSPDDRELSFTTHVRLESAYKKALNALMPGDHAELFKIKGEFILPADTKMPLVFIAGGIGITPFYSMLRFVNAHRRAGPITLIHVSREPHLFETELSQLPFAQYRVGRAGFPAAVETVTATEPDARYFVVGSPAFVDAARELLSMRGIPAERVLVDDWEYADAAD